MEVSEHDHVGGRKPFAHRREKKRHLRGVETAADVATLQRMGLVSVLQPNGAARKPRDPLSRKGTADPWAVHVAGHGDRRGDALKDGDHLEIHKIPGVEDHVNAAEPVQERRGKPGQACRDVRVRNEPDPHRLSTARRSRRSPVRAA